ncbi:MAG: hypothetical protein RLZZ153_647 [Pseudomonadota bacterium]
MTTVRAHSLVAQIHEALRERIAAGMFPPGTAVSIAEVAKVFSVSATPVREALARLAAEGQLRFVENIGYSVPPLPDAGDYVNWAVARIVVECNSLHYILGPLDVRLLDEAEAINERIRDTAFGTGLSGVRQFSELNWRFHAKLIGLARNPLLDDIHAKLYAAPQFSRIFLGRGNPNQGLVAAEHTKILRQLRRGNREGAAAALRDHIIDSLERDARLSHLSVSLKRLVHSQTTTPSRKQPPRSPR